MQELLARIEHLRCVQAEQIKRRQIRKIPNSARIRGRDPCAWFHVGLEPFTECPLDFVDVANVVMQVAADGRRRADCTDQRQNEEGSQLRVSRSAANMLSTPVRAHDQRRRDERHRRQQIALVVERSEIAWRRHVQIGEQECESSETREIDPRR